MRCADTVFLILLYLNAADILIFACGLVGKSYTRFAICTAIPLCGTNDGLARTIIFHHAIRAPVQGACGLANRLCSKLYPCLEIDATIQYALDERKEVLSNADKGIISPYNTYKNAGLPAGPISNPGIASIRAALYPAESDDYFYALGNDGVHHFSRTYYEHQDFLESLNADDTTTDTADETAPDAAQTDETAAGGEAGGSDENTQTP